jgi:anti-anti-sigma factor
MNDEPTNDGPTNDEQAFRIVTVTETDPVCIVCEGELDIATLPELGAALSNVASDAVLDCTALTFLDAATMGLLVRHQKRLERSGHALELAGVNGSPRRALQVVGLLDRFATPPAPRSPRMGVVSEQG